MEKINKTEQKINNYKHNLLDKIKKEIINRDSKKRISSIVVTGSFGRNEETYEINKENIKLKSDVEIAIVYKNAINRNYIEQIIKEVSQLFDEDLNLMPISKKRIEKKMNYNNGFTTPKKYTLFTFDLYNGSYTLWGEKIIEKKKVDNKVVDKYEAKRIVSNRIGELSYLTSKNQNQELKIQWESKLLLAIGTAWLVLNDKYISSYYEQFLELKRNLKIIKDEVGECFFMDFEKAFLYLRKNGEKPSFDDKLIRNYVYNLNNIFIRKKLNKSSVNNIARNVKYAVKLLKYNYRLYSSKYENELLSRLIEQYYNNSKTIYNYAKEWHNVIY